MCYHDYKNFLIDNEYSIRNWKSLRIPKALQVVDCGVCQGTPDKCEIMLYQEVDTDEIRLDLQIKP